MSIRILQNLYLVLGTHPLLTLIWANVTFLKNLSSLLTAVLCPKPPSFILGLILYARSFPLNQMTLANKEAEIGLQSGSSLDEVLLTLSVDAQAAGMWINVAIKKQSRNQRRECPLCATSAFVGLGSNCISYCSIACSAK